MELRKLEVKSTILQLIIQPRIDLEIFNVLHEITSDRGSVMCLDAVVGVVINLHRRRLTPRHSQWMNKLTL